jgi:hypothetical protein
VDGSERLQLTSESQFKLAYVPRWSPNGRQIAFMGIHVGGSGEFKVYVTSPDGGIAQKLIAGDRDDADPNWSPDGNSILFGRFPLGEPQGIGPMDLQVLDLRSHTPSKVPGSEGLWSPRWSPDGRYIVALTTKSDRIMLFDFNSRKWTEPAKISASYEEWSTKGDSVNFIGRFLGGEEGLFKVAIADHKLQEVVPLKEFRRAPGLGRLLGRRYSRRGSADSSERGYTGHLRARRRVAITHPRRYQPPSPMEEQADARLLGSAERPNQDRLPFTLRLVTALPRSTYRMRRAPKAPEAVLGGISTAPPRPVGESDRKTVDTTDVPDRTGMVLNERGEGPLMQPAHCRAGPGWRLTRDFRLRPVAARTARFKQQLVSRIEGAGILSLGNRPQPRHARLIKLRD